MDALALANSLHKRHGRVDDLLDPDLGLHPLRETIRELFDAAAAGSRPRPGDIQLLNSLNRTPSLRWDARGPRLGEEDEATEAVRTAIELLSSGRIRRCGNPRCILFYLARGRRRYCSETCGNRARVARHTAR